MEVFQNASIAARDDPELEQFLNLFSDFGRTKLSLSSLMIRPVWSEKVREQFREAGILEEGRTAEEQLAQWLPVFYRLSRHTQRTPGAIAMRTVAEIIGVPVSTATRFVDGLVRHGLLERQPDAHDRRLVLVKLTPKGQQVFEAVDEAVRQRISDLLEQFQPEERQQLLTLGLRLFSAWRASLEVIPQPTAEQTTAPFTPHTDSV